MQHRYECYTPIYGVAVDTDGCSPCIAVKLNDPEHVSQNGAGVLLNLSLINSDRRIMLFAE